MSDAYEDAENERQKYIDLVLESKSPKKIVVAGPGTGKTYLFKKVLHSKNNSLTLTFVNTLVEDLCLELFGLCDVRTLHSFARSALSKIAKEGIKVFPKLSAVIKEDAKILLDKEINFDSLFHNRNDECEEIKFYKSRKYYYDKYYGYSDIIFAIVKYFEANKHKVPTYEQVVVDEFQDFNKLEVSLIDLLAEKNSILIAGDDDQALYDFKDASSEHIRHKYSDTTSPDYTSFTLPFCSRCTQVIVDAANNIIKQAVDSGHLDGRIEKDYTYFKDQNKDKESGANPKIVYSHQFSKKIPWFISQRMENIARDMKGKFSVLIISPTKVQSHAIAKALKRKGFGKVESVDRKDEKEATFLDGLKILLEDKNSNLGWRIIAKILLSEADFKSLILETNKKDAKKVVDILDKAKKTRINKILQTLKTIMKEGEVKKEDLEDILKEVKVDPYQIAQDFLREEINAGSKDAISINPGLKKINIKMTTIQGAKGLSADYVFITHFDDQYFIGNKDKTTISNQDICNLLVALTRARKKLYLISSNAKKDPIFLSWIGKDCIEECE